MRPGLLFVGGILAVLGIATVATFTLVPVANTTTRDVNLLPQPYGPHTSQAALLDGTDAASGTFSVTWRATTPISVQLFDAPGCRSPSSGCASGAPLATWAGSANGTWSLSGGLKFPFLVLWSETANASGNFSATGSETTSDTPAAPLITQLAVYGAGAALTLVGALSVFLGLFLRGGVYRGPAPTVSRSADDVEELAGPPRPPTG